MRKLVIPAAFFLCLSLSSCFTMNEDLKVSYDVSNEHEGGNSALGYNDYGGANVGLAWAIGLSGAGNRASSDFLSSSEIPSSDAIFGPARTSVSDKGGWALQIEPEFVQKGSKFGGSKTRLNYITLAGDLLYVYPVKGSGQVFGGLGPYIGYGVGGSVSAAGFSEKAFGGDDGYKRFDAGLHLTAGYRFDMGLAVDVAYEYGIANKSPEPDFTSHNRTFSVEVGYSIEKIIGAFKRK